MQSDGGGLTRALFRVNIGKKGDLILTETKFNHDEFTALCEQARALSEDIEAARQLPADFARALAKAGMFRLFTPHIIGGLELSPPEGLHLIETLALHDAATAWNAMICTTSAIGSAYMEQDIARQIFGGEETITCGIFAPTGRALKDGNDYIVSGRWQWGSGSANADWIGLGAFIIDTPDDAPNPATHTLFMVPRKAVIFHDTWHTLGLAGSSSGDVEVKNLRVPKNHGYQINAKPWAQGTLYKFPYFTFLATGIGAVALGNAAAAIRAFEQFVQQKKAQGASRSLAETGRVQSGFAQAQAGYHAAHAFYWAALEKIWDMAQTQNQISPEDRAHLRLACTHAVRQCADVVRMIHDLAGGTSVYKTSPIQRQLRDAQTMTQHMMTGLASYEMVGRVLLGGFNPSMNL